MKKMTIAERAANGAAVLDELAKDPTSPVRADWHRQVNTAQLDIRIGDNCVLGQIYRRSHSAFNGFDWARYWLKDRYGWTRRDFVENGFLTIRWRRGLEREEFEELTMAWREEILRRREQDQLRRLAVRNVDSPNYGIADEASLWLSHLGLARANGRH